MSAAFRPETPFAMAQILVRRPHTISTIQTMILNDFGRVVPTDELERLRAKHEVSIAPRRTSKQWNEPMEFNTTAHNAAMALASKALLARIWDKHRPIMLYARDAGRLVVQP